mgnify:CR=1 FL=1
MRIRERRVMVKLTKEQQETLLGKLASFGYDIDEVKQGKQRLATA